MDEERFCSCGGFWILVQGNPTVTGETEWRHEPWASDVSGHAMLGPAAVFDAREGGSASDG